jgi:hypothetical protein
MGKYAIVSAVGEKPRFRIHECPYCAYCVDAPHCGAYTTLYAMGDVGPSKFSGVVLDNGCEKSEPAPPHFRFFEGPTLEEATKRAVEALGDEVAKRLKVVRRDSPVFCVHAKAETLGRAVAEAKAQIPRDAIGIELVRGSLDAAHPEFGECEVRCASDPKIENYLAGTRSDPGCYRSEMEETTVIESGKEGVLAVPVFSKDEVWREWRRLIADYGLPAEARIANVALGRKGFLGLGKRLTEVTWKLDPKWRIRWHRNEAEWQYRLPISVVVRVSTETLSPKEAS